MAALSEVSAFKKQVDSADEKITASLTQVGQTGRFEFTVIYTATDEGGTIKVNRTFRGLTSTTDSGVINVSE